MVKMENQKRALVLINKTSGTGRAGNETLDIATKLAINGYEPVVYPILPGSNLTSEEIIPGYDGKVDMILCSGGDGTLNHVMNAIMHLKKKPILSYLPSGSTNDFAKGLGIPASKAKAVEVATSGTPFTYDVGKMNDKYCKQGSIYRWLNPDKITSEYIKICFIFTDWNNQLALANKDYPQCKICYKDIPLMSLEETEGFIKNKLYEIENYFDKPEEDIPRCSDDDLWRRDAKYKYYSKETATRATKVFNTPGEARAYCASQGKGFVKEVKGEVKRCPMCPAFTICKQRGEYFA